MTDYDLRTAFGSGPADAINEPGGQYTLGVAWDATSGPVWLKGYAFWRPADLTITGPVEARTWTAAGVAVPDSSVAFSLAGSGYQVALLPTPVPVNVGTEYRSGAHFPNGRYTAVVDYWGTGAGSGGHTAGPLRAKSQAAAPDGEQGVLESGAAIAFPSIGSGNASNFFVTPILTDEDPGGPAPSGAVSHAVAVGASVAGQKVASGAVAAAVLTSGALAGQHVGTSAVSAPVSVSGSVSGAHQGSSAVGHAVTVGANVEGMNPAQAPRSAVLCSAWATVADIPESIRTDLALTDAQWSIPLMVASEILWAVTGRRWYGDGCTETAYLRSVPPSPGTGSWPYHSSWRSCSCWYSGATWINGYPISPFAGPWSHVEGVYAVRMPRDRVSAITAVTVGGLPFTSYTFTRSGWLERLDGKSWDVCSGDTEVTYQYGEAPPLAGVQAAVTLAVELARDMHGLGKCRLPKRLTSITRQGVTVDIADSLDILREGGTGLTSVDLWIYSVNPEARPQAAGVWSPDVPRLMLRRNP